MKLLGTFSALDFFFIKDVNIWTFGNFKDSVLKTVIVIYKSYFSLLRLENIFYVTGCRRVKLVRLIELSMILEKLTST